jgi:hypothetical protein
VTCSGGNSSPSIDASTAFVAGVSFDGLSMNAVAGGDGGDDGQQ